MGNVGPDMNASNFFISLSDEPMPEMYKKHTIFGQVVETDSFETLDKINTVQVN
jgi:peptidyl-prolyl cis-trans isomerase-like 4